MGFSGAPLGSLVYIRHEGHGYYGPSFGIVRKYLPRRDETLVASLGAVGSHTDEHPTEHMRWYPKNMLLAAQWSFAGPVLVWPERVP